MDIPIFFLCFSFFFGSIVIVSGTEKRGFDYSCILASFKSSIVLNSAQTDEEKVLSPDS